MSRGRPEGSPTGTMHHVDDRLAAADVARPSAPSGVTVALETGAGRLRAYHRRPGCPGGLGYPVAPTVTASPGIRPRTAGRPSRAGNETGVDLHHWPAGVDPRPHPLGPHLRYRAAGREQAGHHCWIGQGLSAGHRWQDGGHRATLDRWRYRHPAPVTTPTPTTASTTTAAPTTTLATPTSTEPTTTEPTTTGPTIP